MKNSVKKCGFNLALLLALTLNTAPAFSEDDPIVKEEKSAKAEASSPKWDTAIQEKYGLTSEQTADLRAKGFNNPQIAILSQLSKSSGKPLEEVVRMRQEEKMGWGRIAKELGVKPGEIGQSVSSMRKEIKKVRHSERVERRQGKREERKQSRLERRKEKAEKH